MTINWYPGHMHKARKEMNKLMQAIDCIVELVDARLPFSSQNPLISQWRQQKPSIVILTKADLADSAQTAQWQRHLEDSAQLKSLAYTRGDLQQAQQILSLCRKLAPAKAAFKAINVMVTGIPNVGKSTLINTLAGKPIAKTGNEPAVTKRQQKIYLDDAVILHDTPGILWPKINNPGSGYRLAMIGSIKNTAFELEDLGFYAAELLLTHYPEALHTRYQLDTKDSTPLQFLEAVGRKRGAKQAGGRIDLYKACAILLQDLRNGLLGRITLETPAMISAEVEFSA